MNTATTTNGGTVVMYEWVPRRGSRIARWYLGYLEWLCTRTGHMGACRLLNARGPFRLWERFLGALIDAGRTSTQRRIA